MKRECGSCTLCCRLVPVPELAKKADTRCRYQRTGKGCSIYANRPMSCRMWSCYWLDGPDAGDLRRPDRVHYVIDCMTDHVAWPQEDGTVRRVSVIQIWCDPKHPEAWRDQALVPWLERMAKEKGLAALVRFGGSEQSAIMLWAPAMSPDGQWHALDLGPCVQTKAELEQRLEGAEDYAPLG